MWLGDGRQALFWEDRWWEGQSIKDSFPCLYQLVVPRNTRKTQSVRHELVGRQWIQSITKGLSMEAVAEYLELWEAMESVQFTDQPNKLIWRWTQDGCYTAHSADKMLHAGSTKFNAHNRIWKAWSPLRVKIFLCLALRRRHWTGDRWRQHGLEASELCFLCDQEQESIDYIISSCSYTRELWHRILLLQGIQLPQSGSTH